VFGLRGRLQTYLTAHPAAMVAIAAAFVALGIYLLITDPNGTSCGGVPMWFACPILIVLMLGAGASGIRRVRARRRDGASGAGS
jgi:hypothetical protein